MKHVRNSLFFVLLTTQIVYSQWSGFVDPDYDGTTRYAEWDIFTTTTNAIPDVSGSGVKITENGTGFVTSSLNVYSFSSDLDFTLSTTNSRYNDLGQLNLQILTWGQANPITNAPKLDVNSSNTNLAADNTSVFFDDEIEHPTFGTTRFIGYNFYWDFSELNSTVNAFSIDFGLLVHTSLDKVRLDTTTETTTPDPEPIVPIEVSANIQSGDMVLNFPTFPGNYYQIKWTDDLTSGAVATWNDLGSLISGDGNPRSITDQLSNEGKSRFYSIIITNVL